MLNVNKAEEYCLKCLLFATEDVNYDKLMAAVKNHKVSTIQFFICFKAVLVLTLVNTSSRNFPLYLRMCLQTCKMLYLTCRSRMVVPMRNLVRPR